MQFDQQIGGKLANPLRRSALAALDAAGREFWRVSPAPEPAVHDDEEECR